MPSEAPIWLTIGFDSCNTENPVEYGIDLSDKPPWVASTDVGRSGTVTTVATDSLKARGLVACTGLRRFVGRKLNSSSIALRNKSSSSLC